jgi:membrane associated rhomboid family serine protease
MFKTYFWIPYSYLFLIIAVFVLQSSMPWLVARLGLFPREPAFLLGIVSTVFLHANIEHLASNLLPLSACLFGLFYFYREIAPKVTVLCHVLTGLLMWFFARFCSYLLADSRAKTVV